MAEVKRLIKLLTPKSDMDKLLEVIKRLVFNFSVFILIFRRKFLFWSRNRLINACRAWG